ncbi:FAD-binding and (Fe-S)-binding domain-containing protein [Prauserella alba]|uniref:FAD-binding and (Fe-S)-binding domain-containing protein n=1 Tax=Prauserella alba TaxID=176898 RepID=UPI0020A2AF9B|nr:FAD-binding and (Fe-S)-binding domain-containing protein [Prauserella alba]MCP2183034.1 FAD/FMN-containing dehydrogenase [Prauserella alba]
MTASPNEVSELARALSDVVDGEVRADTATRALYSTDASNYRHVPLAVVAPRSDADVLAALEVCAQRGVPVLPRGAGTSIGGQAANTAVVLDFTRHLDQLLDLDPEGATARVRPGLVLDELQAAAAPHGLTFGPDPSTHSRCTLGGMIGNNACGSHSVAWGKTSDNVRSLEIALADGTVLDVGPTTDDELRRLRAREDRVGALYRDLDGLLRRDADLIRASFPDLTRRVSGYNLDALLPENGWNLARALVGSEGTCATLLSATVELVAAPRVRSMAVLGFADNIAAAEAVPELLGLPVLTMEGIDGQVLAALRERRRAAATEAGLPDGSAWLYLETGGDTEAQANERARQVAAVAPSVGATALVVTDPAQRRALWRIREEGAGLATRLADGSEAWSGWEDAAVPPHRLGPYLREFEKLLEQHGRRGAIYGHFGDGCLHVRIDFPLTADDARQRYRSFLSEAADLVVAHGGSLSGEHGDGQARAELLPKMFPPDVIRSFGEFKAVFDPENRMNPNRVVDPAPLDADLRPVVAPPVLPTRARLALQADDGDLGAATRRCVGVGKCLASAGGVMCPSYRATGEEQHSTRGRARLLFEMLAGDVVTDGWRSPEVKEALDLCLGCKGCKTDCPVGVDMAAYKAEFLNRHYDKRPRPVSHYGMGALPRWLRVGALAPRLVNAVAGSRLAPLLKRLGGVAAERDIPALAPRSLCSWWRSRGTNTTGGAEVVLWPDTFTNHFDPDVGRAAVAVLEELGYEVHLPARSVCCGLTWYSTGQLDTARKKLLRTLDALEPWLARGVPVIGLEPSCTAMLRADAAELLPDDPRVPQLAACVRTFAEHVGEPAAKRLAARGRDGVAARVLTQVHCHQHADLGFDADRGLLGAVADEVEVLDGGCCGLAGNFGFERGHYEVSVACGEHELLPAVRAADAETEVLADGFSCRTQIRQLTSREPVHLATLTARALGLSERGGD